jgi:hypothetical protein
MSLQVSGQVSRGSLPNVSSGTAAQPLTQGQFGDVLVSEVNARYSGLTNSGIVRSASVAGAGITLAATNLFSTAIATFTPILAIYNPSTSSVRLVVLQAWVGVTADPASAGVTGGFFWVGNNNQAITNTASAGSFNTGTFISGQGNGIGISISNATLTGAVGNPFMIRPISHLGIQTAQPATATATLSPIIMEEVAGSISVPPGAYVAMANGISNTTATVIAGMTWAELPI